MCKMCRFAGVPTPKSVSEFIRDSPGHWDTGTGGHKGKNKCGDVSEGTFREFSRGASRSEDDVRPWDNAAMYVELQDDDTPNMASIQQSYDPSEC